MQPSLEEVAEALVVLGVDLVVPLLQPGQVLLHDGEERGRPFGGPAVLFDDLGAVCGHRLTEIEGIPAGPAYEQGGVAVAAHGREANEAFLRDVQRAPQAPVDRLQEVRGAVLGRRGMLADLFPLAAPPGRFDAGRVLLPGFVLPSRGRGFDLGVNPILVTLARPCPLPVGALCEARRLVAQDGEDGDALGFDERLHQ